MFKIRTQAPTAWSKIWNNANNGGISWCIDGRPNYPVANVLSNCVGYACSRFNEVYNELTGYTGMKFPQYCCNAEDFWTVAKQLGHTRSQKPQEGSIMVWEGIGSLAGHVAIVERVLSDVEVYTSESGYDSPTFWNATRNKGGGNWGADGNYKFLGFIYNPAIKEQPKSVKYRVFDIPKKKWLGVAKDGTKASTNADRLGAIAIKTSKGKIRYCVHNLKGEWLPFVTGYNLKDFNNGFAGAYRAIDGLAISATGIKLAYRVKTTKGWLPWVYSNKCNIADPKKGYAGNMGDAIINVQIKVKA